jgi:hypothetical protein
MTFFSRIGGFFKKIGSGINRVIIRPIGSGITKTVNWVKDSIVKPTVDLVKSIGSSAKAVITNVPKVLEKIANRAPEVVDKTIDGTEKIIDSGAETVSGFGKFMSNPMSWLLIGGASIIILPKILDKL